MPRLQTDAAGLEVDDSEFFANVAEDVECAAVVLIGLVQKQFVGDGKKPRVGHEIAPRLDVGPNLVIHGVVVENALAVQFDGEVNK